MLHATFSTEENDEDVHMVKKLPLFQPIDVKLLEMVSKFESLIEKVEILLFHQSDFIIAYFRFFLRAPILDWTTSYGCPIFNSWMRVCAIAMNELSR